MEIVGLDLVFPNRLRANHEPGRPGIPLRGPSESSNTLRPIYSLNFLRRPLPGLRGATVSSEGYPRTSGAEAAACAIDAMGPRWQPKRLSRQKRIEGESPGQYIQENSRGGESRKMKRGGEKKRSEQTSIALHLLRPGGTLCILFYLRSFSFLSGVFFFDARQDKIASSVPPGIYNLN